MTRGTGRRSATLMAVVGMAALALAGGAPAVRSMLEDGTWQPTFPASGLVANELDVTSSADRVPRSANWIVTSGSLFGDDGEGWTGRPDGSTPDPQSTSTTGSAVFRVVSQPVFLSCRVELDLRLDAQVSTPRTPPQDYDGVHVFVRYQDPWNLYAVSVARRDGLVVVKRKESRASGPGRSEEDARYVTLASATAPFPLGVWRHVVVEVSDVTSGVHLTLTIDGRLLLDVVDEGVGGGHPIVSPGRVGLRGDNTEFHVRNIVVTPTT